MTVLRETLDVAKPLEEVFAFVGDFANSERWDPGVASAKKVGDGPIAIGTRYDLDVRFNERVLPMTYTVTAWDPPRRVVLEGRGPTVNATDEITFEAIPTGTRIRYMADLRLKGPLRILEPLMRRRFQQVADDAMAGMRSALA
ncbi:MAG: SRPBCC family protein [Actinomycetota bacterium]